MTTPGSIQPACARRRLGRMLAAALMACGLGASVLAQAAPVQRPLEIPVEDYLGVLASIQASAHGHPARFLLDTAGGITVVAPGFASEQGCVPWGRITGFRMRGDRLDLQRCDHLELLFAGVPTAAATAGVWDFSAMLPKDAPPLAGSVALDAFADEVVTLDLGGHRLILESPASVAARVKTAIEVPAQFSRESGGLGLVPFIGIKGPHGLLWLELDSGNDGALHVARHAAADLGLAAGVAAWQPAHIEVVPGLVMGASANVEDLVVDGNIGAPVLKQWLVTISYKDRRIWIAPRPAPAQPAA